MNNIPSELFQSFPNLTNLILRENSLNKWKTEFLQNADKLSYLYITENPIEVFPDKAFSLSPNLKTLAISFTNVKEFQPDVFEGLDELEHLELNNNPIGDKLTTDTFKWLKGSLRRLKLDDIGLKMISKGLFEGFENLDSLLLKDNLFTQIDATLLPPSLQSLEISEYQQVKIHNSTYQYSKIFYTAKKIQVLNAPETLQIIRVRRKPKKEEL